MIKGETYKIDELTGGRGRYIAHAKPIYFLDNGIYQPVDEGSKIEFPLYTFYDKLPYSLKIFKDKIGYEIESKKTDDKYTIELDKLDDKIFDKDKIAKDDLEFTYQITSNGVRLWKDLKTNKSPKKFKWKVIENAKPTYDKTIGALNFVENIEAYDPIKTEKDSDYYIDIPTKKTKIDKLQFYWEEIAPKTGVKIDTDVTYFSSASDGRIVNNTTPWATCRNATSGSARPNTEASNGYMVNADGASPFWVIRSWFYFDTSGIPDAATVTAAALGVYGDFATSSDVSAQLGTQADPYTGADFDSFSGSLYGFTSWASGSYNTITFNAQGRSDVDVAGITKVCIRDYQHDYLDVEPVADIHAGGYYADDTGTSRDPKLEITYTEVTFIPKIMVM